MPSDWRQGDLLAPDDAIALGVVDASQSDTRRVLVISHSCDIASDADIEPTVELLVGLVVRADEATSQNGHSIRKLHLGAVGLLATEWAQYVIADRREVAKADLLRCVPWSARRYPAEQRAVLRRWLAQRYARAEFPDAFVDWLKQSGVGRRFEDIGKEYSACLVGIYFDFDDDSERNDPLDPYVLGITLVYGINHVAHEKTAYAAREKLEALFARRCRSEGRWRWIELTYCDALSEEVFNLRAARTFRRWRFEHRSLQGEPIDAAE